jgi:hypothetical protein
MDQARAEAGAISLGNSYCRPTTIMQKQPWKAVQMAVVNEFLQVQGALLYLKSRSAAKFHTQFLVVQI